MAYSRDFPEGKSFPYRPCLIKEWRWYGPISSLLGAAVQVCVAIVVRGRAARATRRNHREKCVQDQRLYLMKAMRLPHIARHNPLRQLKKTKLRPDRIEAILLDESSNPACLLRVFPRNLCLQRLACSTPHQNPLRDTEQMPCKRWPRLGPTPRVQSDSAHRTFTKPAQRPTHPRPAAARRGEPCCRQKAIHRAISMIDRADRNPGAFRDLLHCYRRRRGQMSPEPIKDLNVGELCLAPQKASAPF